MRIRARKYDHFTGVHADRLAAGQRTIAVAFNHDVKGHKVIRIGKIFGKIIFGAGDPTAQSSPA